MADNLVYQSQSNQEPTPTQQAKEEAFKEGEKKKEIDRRRFDNLINSTNKVLTRARTALDIFPDSIEVEPTRVLITHRQFLTSQINTVDIRDITEVYLQTGIIFSTVTLNSRYFTNYTESIIRIRNSEAIKIKRIIDGLRILNRENLDVPAFSREELLRKLEQVNVSA